MARLGKARQGKARQGLFNLIKKMKRLLVISDTHCGHVAGLTPPQWQLNEFEASSTKRNKWAILQRELWTKFINILEKNKPFDYCFHMGDMIDGKGTRSGGVEQVTTDRSDQSDMMVHIFAEIRQRANKKYHSVAVFGTDYHVSNEGGEDWEEIIKERAGLDKIGNHEWVNINGCIFDLKHHIAGSTIPHGRFTAQAREKLWNVLWAERDYVPNAHVILRGHVHYFAYCGSPGWVAMTLPALQGMGTRYGARRFSGLVDWGVTIFDIDEKGQFDWRSVTMNIDAQKAKVLKF